MGRLITYLLLLFGSLFFWIIELWINYSDYAGRDPSTLKTRFQAAYAFHSDYMLFSELIIPLMMSIAFLAMLIFKLAARPVRVVLGFFLMLGAEFWVWRSFFFKDRMAVYYALSEAPANIPLNFPDYHVHYMISFIVAFAIVVLMRESVDERTIGAQIRDRKLRESLKSWVDKERMGN